MNSRLPEIFRVFLRLGCTSFGGPVAHLGYFHEEFVRKRRWLQEEAYADLLALCQALPGPSSSQLVYCLGMQRGGFLGALVASFCFTLPSALMMILFAYGLTALGGPDGTGWLHGLKLAAVAVVAQAVWTMGKKLCPDRTRITLALSASALLLLLPGAFGQLLVIATGSAVGWLLYRTASPSKLPEGAGLARHHAWAAATLVLFALLLLVLPLAAQATGWKSLGLVDGFYRSGSLVFGGGHVILPLLRAELVPHGWISDDAFLAGYGAAQAVPGPLFTLSAYLGTIIQGGHFAWLGGLLCLCALFLPGWLLIGGVLPFWHLLRDKGWMQAALKGTNASVVGILLAALCNPVWKEGVSNSRDFAAVIGAVLLLEAWRRPAWLVVLLCAAAAQWIL